MWYSADDDTGTPEIIAGGVPVAYLQETEGQPETVDLISRTAPMRRTPAGRIGLTMVCPVEKGTDEPTDWHSLPN